MVQTSGFKVGIHPPDVPFFSLHVKVGCAIYLIKKKALLLRKYLANACCVTFSNKGCIYEEIIRFR